MVSEHIELSEIERKVITNLAEQGPLSGYDFHLAGKRQRGSRKAIMSSGYWIKVLEHLGPKGLKLITQVNLSRHISTDERGRRKDLYWLTEKGIAEAILNKADSKFLLDNLKKVYPNDYVKASLVEVLSGFDEDLQRIMLDLVIREPKIDERKIVALTMLGIGKGLSVETVNSKMVSILRKYPKEYGFYRKGLRRSAKQLKRLIQKMNGVKP